ncbi:MAG: DUF309 domain-containing protein [Planctomycetota bacterium]
MPRDDGFPDYSYVPGLWPHPHSHPQGHRFGPPFPASQIHDLGADSTFRLGVALFDSGYYWEAHEAWEHLWHAAGRKGPDADFLKALIQLAVVGVKVREGRLDGACSHARRAQELLAALDAATMAGIDVQRLARRAGDIADHPPATPEEPRQPVEIVFPWRLG